MRHGKVLVKSSSPEASMSTCHTAIDPLSFVGSKQHVQMDCDSLSSQHSRQCELLPSGPKRVIERQGQVAALHTGVCVTAEDQGA